MTIPIDQPSGLAGIAAAVRRGGQAEQKWLIRPLPASQADLLHHRCKRRRDGAMRLVEDDQGEVCQKLVLIRGFLESDVESLDGRNDNVAATRRLRPGLIAPQPGDA